MTVPFFWLSLGWTLGVLLGMIPVIPVWSFTALFALAMFLLMRFKGERIFILLLILSTAFLGAISWHLDHRRPSHAVENFFEWKGTVEGIVKTRPYTKVRGKKEMTSFVLKALRVKGNYQKNYETCEINGDAQVFLFQNKNKPGYGDRIKIYGKLESPKPAMNPGEFDYQKHLARQDIYAVLKGYGKNSVVILEPGKPYRLGALASRLQEIIERKVDRIFSPDVKELLKALITGNRKDITSEVRDEFMRTGTSHLLAISGLNIVLVAGTVYLGLIAMRLPQAVAAAWSLAIALMYVLVSGAGLPVQRAGWMAGAAFLAVILNREKHSFNLFFMAYFVMLVMDSKNLANVSFQLSFLSVLSLMIYSRLQARDSAPILFKARLQGVGESFAASLGTLPIVLYYFNVLSLTNLLANSLAIPLFHLALLGAFAGLMVGDIPWLGGMVIAFAEFFSRAGMLWIRFWAGFDWGYLFLTRPRLWQMMAYYIFLAGVSIVYLKGAGWWGSKKSKNILIVTFLFWTVCLGSFFIPAKQKVFALTALSAGRNEVFHLDFGGGGHWLINTGRSFPSNQAEWILTPYLRSKGIKNMKGILLTDMLKKHTGGLRTLARNFNWDYLIVPPNAPGEIYAHGYRLNRGECVRHGETQICSVGFIQGQMILEITRLEFSILILPNLSQAVMDWAERQPLKVRAGYDFIMAPAVQDSKIADSLSALFAPEGIVSSAFAQTPREIFEEQDIRLWETGVSGAVTLEIGKENLLGMNPFLEGNLNLGRGNR